MKRIVKNLIVVGLLIAAHAINAQPNDISPYIGVDYYQAWMKGKGDWSLIFPKSYPGATGYVGTKFHENFGIELGYDWSTEKKNDWSVSPGSTFFGKVIAPNQAVSGNTTVRRTGGHVDVVGFLPVVDCLELTGSVGFGWVQTKIVSNFNVLPSTTTTSTALASISGKGRGVFRVGLGLAYMVTDMVGIRGKISWESTSNLRVNGNALFNDLGYDSKAFKGTTALAVGAFVKF